jgi:hypothetical protein
MYNVGERYSAPNNDEDEGFRRDAEGHKRLAARDKNREHDRGGTDTEPFVTDIATKEGQNRIGPRVHAVQQVVLESAEIEDGGVGVGIGEGAGQVVGVVSAECENADEEEDEVAVGTVVWGNKGHARVITATRCEVSCKRGSWGRRRRKEGASRWGGGGGDGRGPCDAWR